MSLENKCDTPRVTVVKKILEYFDKHPIQAAMFFGSLAIGFIIFVSGVTYSIILQALRGCLPFFFQG